MQIENIDRQPIIILGGFLINQDSYKEMANWLEDKTNNPVVIIKVSKYEWLLTNWAFGWRNILDRLDESAKYLQKISHTGKITLIGHSSGGIMMRLYLSTDSFSGRQYNGLEISNRLITLGSPHQAKRATKLRAMVDNLYPGCFYSDQVQYISIAGVMELDSETATNLSKNSAKRSYKSISGEFESKGDGLVPVSSSLLKDSLNIVINNTAHSSLFGTRWYCSEDVVKEWWERLVCNDTAKPLTN